MLFNSLTYLIFLPIVFLLYWFLFDYAMRGHKRQLWMQNAFLVVASYVFYGWWDWRFLILIALTSILSWGSGILIRRTAKPKLWLALNIAINLGILVAFKYFNFFVNSFCAAFGLTPSIAINVILPVGISFYTFQALSYSIDVYRKKLEPTRDVVAFMAYVAFFPQLVAGPIERATNLLPQMERARSFDYAEAVDGMRRILWGMFKKVVIADNCATYVDMVWADYHSYSGSTLALAAVLFAFQIYGDFSGYSDIAIGSARLFGIKLKDNFRMPYLSRNMAEFWKRWHISLNTWFVDYVYIPLGGSHEGQWRTIRNTFIIFLLSGLWHGANWTYVAWGGYHALLFIPLILMGRTKAYQDAATWKQLPMILLTFFLATLGWIIFRAPGISEAWGYIRGLVINGVGMPSVISGLKRTLLGIGILMIVEWMQRHREHGLEIVHLHWLIRYGIYYALILIILEYGGNSQSFIYFQF